MSTTAPPSTLAEQIRAVVGEWRTGQPPLALRVRLDGTGPTLAACELWSAGIGTWERRATLPGGAGSTFDGVTRAVREAGYRYTETRDDWPRPVWRIDRNDDLYTLDIQP